MMTHLISGMAGNRLSTELDQSAFGQGGSTGLNPSLLDMAYRALLFVNEKTFKGLTNFVEALQSISGGDTQRGRQLHAPKSESIQPKGLVIAVSNQLKMLHNAPQPLQRRAELMHFCNRFVDPDTTGAHGNTSSVDTSARRASAGRVRIFTDTTDTLSPTLADVLHPDVPIPEDECRALHHVDQTYLLDGRLKEPTYLQTMQAQLIKVCLIFAHVYFGGAPQQTPFMIHTLENHIHQDAHAQFANAYLRDVPPEDVIKTRSGQPTWGESIEAVHYAYTLLHYASYLETMDSRMPHRLVVGQLQQLKTEGKFLIQKEFSAVLAAARNWRVIKGINTVHYLRNADTVDNPSASTPCHNRRTSFANVYMDVDAFLRDAPASVSEFWEASAHTVPPPDPYLRSLAPSTPLRSEMDPSTITPNNHVGEAFASSRKGTGTCYAFLKHHVPLVREARDNPKYSNLFFRTLAATGERMHKQGLPWTK